MESRQFPFVRIYFLQGPNGSGKTTLLQSINERIPTARVVFDPFDLDNEHAVLKQMLQSGVDPTTYHICNSTLRATALHNAVRHALRQSAQQKKTAHVLCDGSPFADWNLCRNGLFTTNLGCMQAYKAVITSLLDTLLPNDKTHVKLKFVFLGADMDVLLKRIQCRDRLHDDRMHGMQEYLFFVQRCNEQFKAEIANKAFCKHNLTSRYDVEGIHTLNTNTSIENALLRLEMLVCEQST